MQYSFNDIFSDDMYRNTRVLFIFGKHNFFNKIVSDTFKYKNTMQNDTALIHTGSTITDEFDFTDKSEENTDEFSDDNAQQSVGNSIDFKTFLSVVNVPNLYGKWVCIETLAGMQKKDKDALMKYIKDPNENGIVIIIGNEWKEYKDLLRNKIINMSKYVSSIQLSFPRGDVLAKIVKQLFEEKGIKIDNAAIDLFLTKMSNDYDNYPNVVADVCEMHHSEHLTAKELKTYMKGIENYVLDDFIGELIKPLANDSTRSKKVLRMMVTLMDSMGAESLARQVQRSIEECIDFRIMINSGVIPMGIRYFYSDTIEDIKNTFGEVVKITQRDKQTKEIVVTEQKNKYISMNEFVFRRKAELASRTSLRDWEYMSIILSKALNTPFTAGADRDFIIKKALYEICTRSVASESRILNDIGFENILGKDLEWLDSIKLK